MHAVVKKSGWEVASEPCNVKPFQLVRDLGPSEAITVAGITTDYFRVAARPLSFLLNPISRVAGGAGPVEDARTYSTRNLR